MKFLGTFLRCAKLSILFVGLFLVVSGCETPEPSAPPPMKPKPRNEKEDTEASIRNLKQINLALNNYASAHRHFPPAYSTDKNGKPLFSWRVLILPFLGNHAERLYKQLHLDEPWDSAHNKAVLENSEMPDIYKTPGSTAAQHKKTNYLGVRGKHSVFSGQTPCPYDSISDGAENTVYLVEVDDQHAVEWTRPDDFEYDPQNPVDGLIGLRKNGFLAGYCDGSVRFFKPKGKKDYLMIADLFSKNDTERTDDEDGEVGE